MEFLRTYALTPGATINASRALRDVSNSKDTNDIHKDIAAILRALINTFDDMRAKDMYAFTDYLLRYVEVTLQLSADPYMDFRGENARGTPTVSDEYLIRAEVISSYETFQETAARTWDGIYDKLGTSRVFKELLRAIYAIKTGKFSTGDTIQEDFTDNVLSMYTINESFTNTVLVRYAKVLQNIMDCRIDNRAVAVCIDALLGAMRAETNLKWIAPAIYILDTMKDDPDQIEETMRSLRNRYLYDLVTAGKNDIPRGIPAGTTGRRASRFNKILTDIKSGNLSTLPLRDVEQNALHYYMLQPISGAAGVIALRMLNNAQADCFISHNSLMRATGVTLEHMVPQNGKHWKDVFPEHTGKGYSECKKLGNLMLVSRELNSAMKNKPFLEKMAAIRNHGKSLQPVTADILNYEEFGQFGPDELNARTTKMANALMKVL